jgi:hypothetical protein
MILHPAPAIATRDADTVASRAATQDLQIEKRIDRFFLFIHFNQVFLWRIRLH